MLERIFTDRQAPSQPGELTDKGRETTLALGQRLRHLYVEQLAFLPSTLFSPNSVHLRASPIPRALESAQQAFYGLYPPHFQSENLPTPVITARAIQEEVCPHALRQALSTS